MRIELVVDNAPLPVVETPPSHAELRLLAQSSLVKAAKQSPLHVIVICDLGEGEIAVYSSGLTRESAKTLAGDGVRILLDHNA